MCPQTKGQATRYNEFVVIGDKVNHQVIKLLRAGNS